jgi:hypothetical protein
MGYLLEIYGLDWSALAQVVGSSDATIYPDILAAEQRIFVGSPGVSWKPALRALIMDKRGERLAARGVAAAAAEIASEEEATAMVALIRARGHRAGEVVRTSRGGDRFRALFSTALKPAPFAQMALAPYLLRRPLFGLDRDDFPSWGGLTKAELAQFIGEDAPPLLKGFDEDQESWLYDLRQALMDVRERGTDLVTLYL